MYNFASEVNRTFPSYLASVSKRVVVQNPSYENEFDLNDKEPVERIHFI